ncbi:UV DNA damage repair endonuclease UvsE [[Eubacterium] cellulosolvens]
MKVGYPCNNRTIGCSADRTFRLKSYSEERLISTVNNNLGCLDKILRYNLDNNILFFRITSELVPFASHPICDFNWQKHFSKKLEELGSFINKHDIRISMHPDQFIVINAKDEDVVARSIAELQYHADVLNLMGLDNTAKIQLHVGGVYGDKDESIARFKSRYLKLDRSIKNRLVIENDDRSYTISDCLAISNEVGIPILFDNFHHELNSSGETVPDVMAKTSKSWRKKDGLPMTDYSSQNPELGKGRHAETIDLGKFLGYIETSKPFDFDIMLEIKDKENSARQAVNVLIKDDRFQNIR